MLHSLLMQYGTLCFIGVQIILFIAGYAALKQRVADLSERVSDVDSRVNMIIKSQLSHRSYVSIQPKT